MRLYLRFFAVVCLAVFVLATAACPKRISIAELESNPAKYSGKDVAIAGRVTNSYGTSIPFLGQTGGVYKIDDGTGSIWVFTKKGVPGKDVQLGVKGKLKNGITIAGKNYGLVLEEEVRRFKKD